MSHADRKEIVPVLRCLGGNAARDRAAGAGPVFDNELLT